MRSSWMLAAGLLLAACRPDANKGEASTNERAAGREGTTVAPTPGERAAPGASAEASNEARLLATTRAWEQAELDAAKLAQQHASSPEVKDYATRAAAEQRSNLDALADLAKAKHIDLDATAVQGDLVLKAGNSASKATLDRLRGLSGTAFDASYMMAQRPSQGMLVQLATQGQQASRDADVGNVLRTIGQQAHDRMNKALTILPKTCGGERAGWGGAG